MPSEPFKEAMKACLDQCEASQELADSARELAQIKALTCLADGAGLLGQSAEALLACSVCASAVILTPGFPLDDAAACSICVTQGVQALDDLVEVLECLAEVESLLEDAQTLQAQADACRGHCHSLYHILTEQDGRIAELEASQAENDAINQMLLDEIESLRSELEAIRSEVEGVVDDAQEVLDAAD